MPALHFDATVQVELQLNDYSCSVGATFWCLRSLGVGLRQPDLEDLMVPALVSQADGLLDGSGASIARLLEDRFGLSATNTAPVTFDQVVARAGQQPIAIGGARWFVGSDGRPTGHWVAVCGFDGTQLLLANPGGTGPHFGQQVLDRAGFEQRAPFAAVWIQRTAGAGATIGSTFRVGNTGGQGANLRDNPSTTAQILRGLADEMEVTGGAHAWRAVSDSAGGQGWIANEYLAADARGYQVANTEGTGASLRTGPATSAELVKVLAEGTAVSASDNAWRQVTEPGGTTGWIADEFLVASAP